MSERSGLAPASSPRPDDGDETSAASRDPSRNNSRSTVSVQVGVPDGLHAICPNCGASHEAHDVTLGLFLGPALEGSRLFLVGADSKLEQVLENVQRVMVASALRRTSGNIAGAAKILGVKYTTLYSTIRRLGLDDPALGLTRKRGGEQSGEEPADDADGSREEPVDGTEAAPV